MKSLIIDTSTSLLSLALIEEEDYKEKIAELVVENYSDPSSNLLSDILNLLKNENTTLNDLDLLIVSKGPGSFTGLRIGLATAKGISVALNKPIVTVPNLEAIELKARSSIKEDFPILSVIDAKKKRYYLRLSEKDNVIVDALDGNIENIASKISTYKTLVITGPDSSKFIPIIKETIPTLNLIETTFPNKGISKELYKLGIKKFKEVGADDIGEGPMYIRRSDAEEALMKKMEEENG